MAVTDDVRWFLLPANRVAAAVATGGPRHRQARGANHTISVAWNAAETQAIVKMAGADAEWRQGQAWVAFAVAIYDRAEHAELFVPLYYTPVWRAAA